MNKLQDISDNPGLHPADAYKELPVATQIEYRRIPLVIINALDIMLKGNISRIAMIRFVRCNTEFDSLLEAKRIVDAVEGHLLLQRSKEPLAA